MKLAFDADLSDKYGRTLATVFKNGAQRINAEIAKHGLGVPMSVGNKIKFLPAIQSANMKATKEAIGLFRPFVSCTLPAQIASASAALEEAESAPAATTSAAAATAVATAAASVATANTLKTLLAAGRTLHDRFCGEPIQLPKSLAKSLGCPKNISH